MFHDAITTSLFHREDSNINVLLSGILEVDEMFFHESFKYNDYITHRKARNIGWLK